MSCLDVCRWFKKQKKITDFDGEFIRVGHEEKKIT